MLDWIGKSAVVRHHRDVPYRLLEPVPELSCGDADSGNLIVQGDNLHALKALLPRYAGQVKCIYIDPPYNTGNEGWVYNDNVNSPEIRRWLGEVVGKEGETLDRHDRWLCMMYPRLVLLKQFLRDDGVIFVSIDDFEIGALECLMGEIFGPVNRLGIFTWQRKKKGSHLDAHMRKMSEFVICYARRKNALASLYGEDAYAEKLQPLVKRTNKPKTLRFPAGKVSTTLDDGRYEAGYRGKEGTGLHFANAFVVEGGVVAVDMAIEGRFVWTQAKLDDELAKGSTIELSGKFGLNSGRHDQAEKTKTPSTLLLPASGIGTNEDASQELAEIFGREMGKVFPYPKPSSLVQYLVRAATHDDRDAVVLDSFAGSGTTAHAVLRQNRDDGGHRRFILVEMDERISREVTAPRMRRVAEGYPDTKGAPVPGLGGGFQFCRIGKPLFNARGHIDPEVRFAELARFVWFVETGMGRSAARTSRKRADEASPLLGIHEGRAVYLLYNGILKDRSIDGGNVLTTPLLEHLPAHDGPKVIYGARCVIGKERLRALGIDFRQLPYDLRVSP
ncbi:site-specific DNA-methyltransferase [Pseudoxanthomonas koreensis]|uniref:site-specific DNA-methyltransferase n=1 Tax=Pseudoxanthomonas koreensis TaxID=266061 RepID=UPI001EE4C1D5|nr:site-specific DNA-methyltransferase [Pseudoxanthomonas koreensis]